MKWEKFFDDGMCWCLGCDLRRWLVGVVWHYGGFMVSVGPFYFYREDFPF